MKSIESGCLSRGNFTCTKILQVNDNNLLMADCCTNLEVYDIVISSHEDDHELTTKFITEAEENIPKIKIAILSDLMEENREYEKCTHWKVQ